MNSIVLSAYVKVMGFVSGGVEKLKEDSGQDFIEYAVLAGAIGVVLAVAFVALPMQNIVNTFVTKVQDCIQLQTGTCV